jgi:hypothetical protein
LQLTATGHYSNLTTGNVTDSVTWTSSDDTIATVSSTGLVTGGANTGTVTITATDPSSGVTGTTTLTVTGPVISISPTSGRHGSSVVVIGQGFVPGSTIKVKYVTGMTLMPRVRICFALIGTYGHFTCTGKIPPKDEAGALGVHTILAKVHHTRGILATTTFTLIRRP